MKKMNMIWTKVAAIALGAVLTLGIGATLSSTSPSNEVEAALTSPHLVGTMNDWTPNSTSHQMTSIGNNKWQWKGQLSQNTEFKVLMGDTWSDANYGWTNLSNIGSRLDEVVIGAGVNIKVNVNQAYQFSVIYDSAKVTAGDWENVLSMELYRTKASTEGINSSRMRIWLDRGVYESDGALNCIQYGSSITDANDLIEPSGYVANDTYFYAYFDVPVSDFVTGTKIRAARVSANRGLIWNKTADLPWASGYNSEMLFVGNDWTSFSHGIINENTSTKVEFLKYVLEGYLTCSNSAVNGYNAFLKMDLTFFKKADGSTSRVSGNLNSVIISDFQLKSEYSGTKGTYTIDGQTKYDRMHAEYLAQTGSAGFIEISNSNGSNNYVLIISISVISLTILSAFYLITRKRKENI